MICAPARTTGTHSIPFINRISRKAHGYAKKTIVNPFKLCYNIFLSNNRFPKGEDSLERVKRALNAHVENFKKYRFLLRELVGKSIKLQYRNSVLGVFWTFLQPLLTMIVLSFVFMRVFGKDSSKTGNYPVYLLCGRLLYQFFTSATKRAMTSIRKQSSMIKKVYVPKYIYPLSEVLSALITFLISLTVLAFVIAYFNIRDKDPVQVTWHIVFIIVPILITFVLSLGVGMILSTVSVFFKDIENIYDVFTMLLFYMTPIVFRPGMLNFEGVQLRILKINPLYGLVNQFRAAVMYGTDFAANWDMKLMYYTAAFAVATVIIGFWLFYRNQDKFILYI